MDWFKKTLFTNRAQKVKKIENDLDTHLLPKHVAIIMDGNGRWAEKRGLPRALGHRAGVESLRKVIRLSSDLGIQVLTLYAFSTENWKRPTDEVRALMDLLVEYLDKEIDELHRNQVNIRVLGNIEPLPEKAKEKVLQAIEKQKIIPALQSISH